MSKAHIIEVRETGVGLAIGDDRGFTFYSAGGRFDALDGREFASLAQLQQAVRALADGRRDVAMALARSPRLSDLRLPAAA